MPVAARFHALRDKVLATNDHAFAEPVRLTFIKPDGRVDPARPAIQIEAILRVAGDKSAINVVNGSSAVINTGKGELAIDPVIYNGPAITVGTVVRALSRGGPSLNSEPTFEVASVYDRTHTRTILELNAR